MNPMKAQPAKIADTPRRSSEARAATLGGLCTNCEHLEDCTYASPVNETWFCEEFSFARPEPLAPAVQAAAPEAEETAPHLGLCMNCDLRDTCTFPKPPGGVWFCGEYK
jgi:hypothetical protein